MQKNRIVVAVAFVALMSGGMIMAADDAPTSDNGPSERGSFADLEQVDNRTPDQAPRYAHEQRVVNTCSDSPLARLLADFFGMSEIMRPCEASE